VSRAAETCSGKLREMLAPELRAQAVAHKGCGRRGVSLESRLLKTRHIREQSTSNAAGICGCLEDCPVQIGYFDIDGDVEVFNKRLSEHSSITPLHNAVGIPAVTIPLHSTGEGLPIGVHFAGCYAEEATLLRLVAQLESAQPWFNKVPEL
jgi:Asp-tRNA(Asn)/Glu-tRNA(Gln) amidotransferase A subunit family amidase